MPPPTGNSSPSKRQRVNSAPVDPPTYSQTSLISEAAKESRIERARACSDKHLSTLRLKGGLGAPGESAFL